MNFLCDKAMALFSIVVKQEGACEAQHSNASLLYYRRRVSSTKRVIKHIAFQNIYDFALIFSTVCLFKQFQRI